MLKKIAIAAAVLAVCTVFFLLTADFGRAMTTGRTQQVPPGSRHAKYLLFPRKSAAGIERAILVSGTELTGTTDIHQYEGTEAKSVPRDRLTLFRMHQSCRTLFP